MRSFREFFDSKKREGVRHLNILHDILEKEGFKVKKFLGSNFNESYLYIFNPEKSTSFAGVRLYKLGSTMCYRVQREETAHPYGTAYPLDIEMMFEDLKEDGLKEDKLVDRLVKELVKELRSFFKQSSLAEKEENDAQDDQGQITISNPFGGGYENSIS